MRRWILPALGLCTALWPALAQADDSDNASALVTVAPIQQGSLPTTITAFGQIQPRDTAQQTIAAQLAVRVSNVKVRAGERIPAGAPMITVAPTPESRASYVQAQLAARLASELVTRDKQLVQERLLTQAELLKAENDEANAKSTLAVLQEEGAAEPQRTLTAPADALITKVDVNPGSIAAQGSPLIEWAPPDSLVLEVGVVSTRAPTIKPGNPVTITPLGSTESFKGTVLSRESIIDATTGLVPVQISFPLDKMLAGEMARAVITAGEAKGLIVPHEAVLVDDDGTVYVVQAVDMEAKKVAVQVVASDGSHDVISGDDLDPKAPVVLEGNHQLDDGTKLRLADASPKGASSK